MCKMENNKRSFATLTKFNLAYTYLTNNLVHSEILFIEPTLTIRFLNKEIEINKRYFSFFYIFLRIFL